MADAAFVWSLVRILIRTLLYDIALFDKESNEWNDTSKLFSKRRLNLPNWTLENLVVKVLKMYIMIENLKV